jgi:hypothetical protein
MPGGQPLMLVIAVVLASAVLGPCRPTVYGEHSPSWALVPECGQYRTASLWAWRPSL